MVSMVMDKKHQQDLEDARRDLATKFDEIESGIDAQLKQMKSTPDSFFVKLQQAYGEIVEREAELERQTMRKRELATLIKDIKVRLDGIRAELTVA